jgi:hypothetical protein
MDPAFVAEFVEAFTAECANAQTRTSAGEAGRQKELEKIRRKLDQLVDAITSGLRSVTLESKLVELEERDRQHRSAGLRGGPMAGGETWRKVAPEMAQAASGG